MRRKLALPTKLASVTAALVYTVWLYTEKKNAFRKAMEFVASYHDTITASITADMPVVIEGISHAAMMTMALKILDRYNTETSRVPNLLNSPTEEILNRVEKRLDADVQFYLSSVESKSKEITRATIPAYVNNIMTLMDKEFRGYLEMVDSEEDVKDLRDYYTGMLATMRPRVENEIAAPVSSNTRKRIDRIQEFCNITKLGMLARYRRTVEIAKKVVHEMDLTNQVENYVKSDVQERIARVVRLEITYPVFKKYMEGEISVEDVVHDRFVVAEKIRESTNKEIRFRVTNGHIPKILINNASNVYLGRSKSVSSDKVMTETQKANVKKLCRERYEGVKNNLEESVQTAIYSAPSLLELASDYYRSVLPEVRNYVAALLIEFSGVLRRSRLEGTQTCVIQFYNMRRVMDYNFFFAMCEEESFNLQKTRTRFGEFYGSEIAASRSKMISLVRMPHINFLYDDSYEFLRSLSELMFFTDETLRETIDEITSAFHVSLADSIGDYLDLGIEDIFAEEERDSHEAVMNVFGVFEGNMRIFEVVSVVEEFATILYGEVSHQVDFINGHMKDLFDSFKVETTQPYNEDFFNNTQKSFLKDGGDIDYDGMKRFVVEHMNAHGESVIKSYDQVLAEFVEAKIVPVGELMDSMLDPIRQTIADSSIGETDKTRVQETLDRKVRDVKEVIRSTRASIMVTLNTGLQRAIVQLDQVMDTTTQNFFNTALHEVVQEFQEWATPVFSGIYEASVSKVSTDQAVLAEEAKKIFEDHVKIFVDLENKHRAMVSTVISGAMRKEAVNIVADYNTISYAARQSIVRGNLRMIAMKAALKHERDRSEALRTAAYEYSNASMLFRSRCQKLAREHVTRFNDAYSKELSEAHKKSSDIRSVVSGILGVLGGELREYFTESHRDIAQGVLAGPANAMPEINSSSVCYPPGLIGLAEPRDGDLQSTMSPHLIVDNAQEEGEALHDDLVVAADTSQILGAAADTYYAQIVVALSHYDSWKDGILNEVVADVEAEMAQELRNNTCTSRPKCGDGTYSCDEATRSCREGYVLFTNSHDVLCCRFDPVAAGFPYSEIGKLVAIEMAWALFTDPSGIAFMAKASRSLALKMGKTVGKAGRSLKMLTKFSSNLSGAVAKVNVRIGGKVASKTGVKAGMKVGTTMAKKVGVKVGGKVAAALGKTLLKGAMKVAVSGPVGLAMLAFDLISLSLDLWDPLGYNDVQAAGQIKSMRDEILATYRRELANEGITHPLVTDPLYNMDEDSKAEFTENLLIDWFTSSISAFISSSEKRWETMPNSESVAEYEREVARLEGVMNRNVNFVQELINQNTENTFLVKSSTVTDTPSHLVGTERDHDYDQKTKTHLMVCSLNAAGVVAFNSFHVQKAEFVNALKSKPIYRWMKVVNGYRVYESVSPEDLMKAWSGKARRLGWAFTEVDADEEFWMQYRYAKEEGIVGMPPRANYMDAWNKDASTKAEAYANIITAVMGENITTYAPEGVAAATVEMVRNQTAESPDWYPPYDDLYNEAKSIVDDNLAELMEEARLALMAGENSLKKSLEAADKKLASENNISLADARERREHAEKEAARRPVQPEFSIFGDGFGQVSPLLVVKQQCEDMGYGNHFVADKGLCEFTRKYCDRYGLTYFYNEDVGTHDCTLSNVQKGFETVFGTTATRGAKKLFGAQGPGVSRMSAPVLLGASGCRTRCVAPDPRDLSVYDTAVELDKLGLGAKFSVWN